MGAGGKHPNCPVSAQKTEILTDNDKTIVKLCNLELSNVK